MQEQLGLKLERQKTGVDVVVIDAAQHPVDNHADHNEVPIAMETAESRPLREQLMPVQSRWQVIKFGSPWSNLWRPAANLAIFPGKN